MTDEPESIRLRDQVRDIQAQLVRSEKMAVLGSLTAGVAHELNNPIGFVKNNTVMLEEYLQVLLPVLREVLVWSREPEGLAATLGERIASASGGEDLEPILDDLAPLLADTREGAQRLEDIVGGLRSFARADTPEGEPFDINQCVKDALKVAWNELKYKATVVQSMTEVQVLNGKPGEIKQVILNLLVNASQALADYGEIRLGTRQLDGEVEFFIADTGTGIAQEHLERLFTPFFTTKPAGKGTGLGLSISRDIVTAHGGRIEVTSKLGEGSEFRVFLPIPQDDP